MLDHSMMFMFIHRIVIVDKMKKSIKHNILVLVEASSSLVFSFPPVIPACWFDTYIHVCVSKYHPCKWSPWSPEMNVRSLTTACDHTPTLIKRESKHFQRKGYDEDLAQSDKILNYHKKAFQNVTVNILKEHL